MTFKEFGNQVPIYRFQQRQNLRNAAVDADVIKATLHRMDEFIADVDKEYNFKKMRR